MTGQRFNRSPLFGVGPDRSCPGGHDARSATYLQRFPFDKIKIDRCFVNGLTEQGGSAAIVQAVVNIVAARQMTTIAKGVETAEQRKLLRSLGCTEMQGYLFSAAVPSAEARQLLLTSRDRAAA